MNNGRLLNEGLKPFFLKTPEEQKFNRAQARAADRKYYGIKLMKSHLSPPCSKCGRHGCKGKCGVKGKPMTEMIKCGLCNCDVQKDASYCY